MLCTFGHLRQSTTLGYFEVDVCFWYGGPSTVQSGTVRYAGGTVRLGHSTAGGGTMAQRILRRPPGGILSTHGRMTTAAKHLRNACETAPHRARTAPHIFLGSPEENSFFFSSFPFFPSFPSPENPRNWTGSRHTHPWARRGSKKPGLLYPPNESGNRQKPRATGGGAP